MMPNVVQLFRTRRGGIRLAVLFSALVFAIAIGCGSIYWDAPVRVANAASLTFASPLAGPTADPVVSIDCAGKTIRGWSAPLDNGKWGAFIQEANGVVRQVGFEQSDPSLRMRGILRYGTTSCSVQPLLEATDAQGARSLLVAQPDSNNTVWRASWIVNEAIVNTWPIPLEPSGVSLADGRILVAYTTSYQDVTTKIAFKVYANGSWSAQQWADEAGDQNQQSAVVAESGQLGIEVAFKGAYNTGGGWQTALTHVSRLGTAQWVRDVHENVPNPGVNDPGTSGITLSTCSGSRCMVWSNGADLYRRVYSNNTWGSASTEILAALPGVNFGPVGCGGDQVLSWNKDQTGAINLGVFSAQNPVRRVLQSFSLNVGDPEDITVQASCNAELYGYTRKLADGSWQVEFWRFGRVFLPVILR